MNINKQSFFYINLRIIQLAGLWIPDQGETFLLHCLYLIYNVFVLGFSVAFNLPMELLALKMTYHKLDQLMKNVDIGLTHFLAAIKMIIWFRRRKEILNIIETLEAKASDYEAIDDFDPKKIINEEKAIKNFTTIALFIFGCSVSITAFFAAVMAVLIDYRKYEVITTSTDNMTTYHYTQRLPYYMAMPFAYDTSKSRFVLTLVYNCFPALHFAWIIVGFDTTFTSLVGYISAHLRILQGAFTTIRPRCIRGMQLSNEPVLHDPKELDVALKKEMARCVSHLQLIFDTCQKVEDIFSYLTLAQVLGSQIIICACLYMVSAIPITSKAFVTELMFLVAVETQIALYCFFGNKVTITGQDIALALYKGDWFSSSKQFKTSMLITMLRTNKPIYLTIGKFSPLMLTTFVTIGRASYSFFAVLKKQNS